MEQTLLFADLESNETNIDYIKNCILDTVNKLGGKLKKDLSRKRAELTLTLDDASLKFIIPPLEDKVADVIAVNYKYNFFKTFLRTKGLDELEYELLLCALISADLDEDKRYIRAKIRKSTTYSIDGIYNFTLKPLKEKWREVVSFIPSYFSYEELKEFVNYLVKEKTGRRVFVDGDKVYDRRFSRLSRVKLTDYKKACVLREVILSNSGEVELLSKQTKKEEFYLKEFFGDKIFFRKSYFEE